jgi:predicted nucleic acid-binding Zn ribbon protein
MVYQYKCTECNTAFDIELEIGKDLPKEYSCIACKGKAVHDLVSQIRSQNPIVPDHMRATSKTYATDTRKLYKKDASIEAMEAKGMV